MMQRPEMLNQRRKKSPVFLSILTAILVLVSAVVLLDSIRAMFMFTVEIKGSSMLNTFYGGERIDGDYRGGDIVYALKNFAAERGDVVIIDTSDSASFAGNGGTVFSSEIIIKRLIATEGDSVRCEHGVVYLKKPGEEYVALDEPYAITRPDYSFPEVTLSEGEIFFLGDNRPISLDSQEVVAYGYHLLTENSIIGVVPEWAISIKWFTTGWENFRSTINSFFT